MLVYRLNSKLYGVFKIGDQHVEFCPIVNNIGQYRGISVTICSMDQINFRSYPVLGYGAVIFNEDIEIDSGIKEFNIETAVDDCKLIIHFGNPINTESIRIEYDYKKK